MEAKPNKCLQSRCRWLSLTILIVHDLEHRKGCIFKIFSRITPPPLHPNGLFTFNPLSLDSDKLNYMRYDKIKCIIRLNILHNSLMQGRDDYCLERLLPGQLLCGGWAVLLQTIKHSGLRLERRVRKGDCKWGWRRMRQEISTKDLMLNTATSVELKLTKINYFKILTCLSFNYSISEIERFIFCTFDLLSSLIM